MYGASTAEVLPDNVLAKGDRMVAWWTPACRRQMFYESPAKDVSQLNGRTFPQPPLLWRVENSDLQIRALVENKRPRPNTIMAGRSVLEPLCGWPRLYRLDAPTG
jgi:hypothetical protein